MTKFIYTGEDERVFPTLGITVTNKDEFDAANDFNAYNISVKKPTKATPAPTVGE